MEMMALKSGYREVHAGAVVICRTGHRGHVAAVGLLRLCRSHKLNRKLIIAISRV